MYTHRITEECQARAADFGESREDHTEKALRYQRRRALHERDAAESVSPLIWRRHLGHDALGGGRRPGCERE